MKKILLLILIILIYSCNQSTEELSKKVKKDIYLEFSKFDGGHFKIQSFNLVHLEGNNYKGVLKCYIWNLNASYDVDVTTDGDRYIYHWNRVY
jgi:hypothetical protein